MRKLIIVFICFLISCQNERDKEQEVIAYYHGDEKSIDELRMRSSFYLSIIF